MLRGSHKYSTTAWHFWAIRSIRVYIHSVWSVYSFWLRRVRSIVWAALQSTYIHFQTITAARHPFLYEYREFYHAYTIFTCVCVRACFFLNSNSNTNTAPVIWYIITHGVGKKLPINIYSSIWEVLDDDDDDYNTLIYGAVVIHARCRFIIFGCGFFIMGFRLI